MLLPAKPDFAVRARKKNSAGGGSVAPNEAAPRHAISPAEQIESWSGDPIFMMSLARGVAGIRAFAQQERRLTTFQISQRTGTSRAALRRCPYTLGPLGHVPAQDGRDFSLSLRVLLLGYVATAMNHGTQASRVSPAEMEKAFLRELEAAASEIGQSLLPSAQ